ncbi:MAG: LysR family transcriptional regulator [Rhodobiaceae bacterium]|nr:LysR family transcriptional regulator [Rhodobiaceae bacterium]MCC0055330.1 LysR family transcriptional regulator [Rhodobiaceae bacterium]
MTVELRHLRNFKLLAEELNFSRAAMRAHISQSSLSEQILRLEDVLGVKLFDRSRRHVKLTMAGEVLREELPGLLDNVGRIVERTRQASGEARERLRVGYSAMALNTPMSRIIQNFRRQHPDIETTLFEQSSNGAEVALMDNALDCVFVPNPPDNPKISFLHVLHDPVVCCLPPDSKLAHKDVLTVEDLRGQPLILPNPGSWSAEFILAACNSHGVEPTIAARASRPSVFLTMVSAGVGISFLSATLERMAPDGIHLRRLGDPPIAMPFSLVWDASRQTAGIKNLIRVTHATLEAMSGKA